MKNLLFILVLIVSFISCKDDDSKIANNKPKPTLSADAIWATTTFKVEGMHCEKGCAAKLQKEIFNLEGVKTSKIDFKNKSAKIVYDKNVMTAEKIVEIVLETDKNYVVSDIITQ